MFSNDIMTHYHTDRNTLSLVELVLVDVLEHIIRVWSLILNVWIRLIGIATNNRTDYNLTYASNCL